MYCMGQTASYYSSVDSDGFSGTISEGFQGDVFLCEILCELCVKLWEVIALWFTLKKLQPLLQDHRI
jgi:hypothetical protein